MHSVQSTTASRPPSRPPCTAQCAAWRATLLVAVLAIALARPGRAGADREHTVAEGQTLSGIAARYGVRVSALAAANGLDGGAALRPGQVLVVPARGVVYVRAGDTLAAIARRNDVSAAELARVNRIPPEAGVRIGQRLMLPGYDAAAAADTAEKRWGAPKRRGVLTLHRLSTSVTRRVRVVDGNGRVRRPALRVLSLLLRPRDSRRSKEPHPRLVRLLAQVSDHFGGRPIHVVSGLRRPGGYTRESSRHVAAQAVDFRIPGVPLETLRDYCAHFDHVGVGYYPHSEFVHLDVRRSNARWTDISGPGEAPQIQRPGLATANAASVAPAREPGPGKVSAVTRASVAAAAAAEPALTDEPSAADDGQAPVEEPADVPVDE